MPRRAGDLAGYALFGAAAFAITWSVYRGWWVGIGIAAVLAALGVVGFTLYERR